MKKTLQGTVVSDKMQSTAVVEVVVWKINTVLKKRYQRHPEIAQEAIRLSKQGLSVAQIADVLLLSEKRVAAWIESDAREDERSTERDHQSGGQ